MIEVLDLENLKIGSVNNKYSLNQKTGRLFLSKQYREFKNLIKRNVLNIKIKSPYYVYIMLETHLDIDNPVKPILDALQEAGIIDNDKNILALKIEKIPCKKNKPNKINIKIKGEFLDGNF